MNILLAYIFVAHGDKSEGFSGQFAYSYQKFFPHTDHRMVVVCNGGLPETTGTGVFNLNHGTSFLPRINDPGWDISAFIEVAGKFPCDMLVCLGESVRFHREGWLERLVTAWEQFGAGFYGVFSSNVVRPHLQTTGFAVDPKLLLGHTVPQNREERYEFEHGKRALWRQVQAMGKPVKLVTFDGVWDEPQWRTPKNILWRGDQSNLLFQCRHSDDWAIANTVTKQKWSRAADSLAEK